MADSPDSSGATLLHSLNAVVSWLHSEGFYAAGTAAVLAVAAVHPLAPPLAARRVLRAAS